ncbi:MAG: hypothetical protein JWO67_2386 [Streptosporangiaceae bacterium]|nr:hypothetical protein [Streptosporangiaceae bacterium]
MSALEVKRQIATAEVKAGMVFTAPGVNLPVDISRVQRDAEYTYLTYYIEIGPRRVRKMAKRKTAGRTTIIERAA